MKRKKFKKLAGYIISFAMVFSVFSIPAAGYADENASDADNAAKTENSEMVQAKSVQSNTSGYVVKKTTDENATDIPEGGVVIDNLFEQIIENYVCQDQFSVYDAEGDIVSDVTWSSSDDSVAKCTPDEDGKSVTVTYVGTGKAVITAEDSDTQVLSNFNITVNSNNPTIGIKEYNYSEDAETPADVKILNIAQYVDNGYGEFYFGFNVRFTSEEYSGCWFDLVEWECSSDLLSISEEGSDYCDLEYLGTPEQLMELNGETLTAKAYVATSYDEDGEPESYLYLGEATCTFEIEDFMIKYGNELRDEDYSGSWNIVGEDGIITDTDELLFVGAFDHEYNKFDVSWKSDDEDIVKIGRKGRIYPIGKGDTTITCMLDGKDAGSFKVSVYDPDTYKKAKYIVNDDYTAWLYQAMYGWNGEVPETITVDGKSYTVTRILDRAFEKFYSDDTIKISIPSTVDTIDDGALNDYIISDIKVAAGNETYTSIDGVLFSADKKTLIKYPAGKYLKNYEIPEGTEKVLRGAFGDVDIEEYITVPLSLKPYDVYENSEEEYYHEPSGAFFDLFANADLLVPLGDDINHVHEYMAEYGLQYSLKINKITNLNALSTGTTSIKLSWTENNKDGVKGYRIYKYDSAMEEYECVKEIENPNTSSYTVNGLSPGSVYSFKVAAYDKYDNTSRYSAATLKTPTKPSKVTISKLKTGSKYITAYWGKKTGTGYEVQIATNSKFTKAKSYKVTSYKTTSKKITKLKKGKTYYVRVRAYKTYGKTTYSGDWSTKKKIKCK